MLNLSWNWCTNEYKLEMQHRISTLASLVEWTFFSSYSTHFLYRNQLKVTDCFTQYDDSAGTVTAPMIQ
jgi:hypothetical protein